MGDGLRWCNLNKQDEQWLQRAKVLIAQQELPRRDEFQKIKYQVGCVQIPLRFKRVGRAWRVRN